MYTLWRIFFVNLFVTTLCSDTYGDGGKAPRRTLNDGNKMPIIGLGTFLGFGENGQKHSINNEVENAVSWALQAGYRLIDTASAYFNEEEVARGIQKSGVPREDVFIVTKLGATEQRHVVQALRDSLRRLNTSYVDLYLIHNPVTYTEDYSDYDIIDYLDTWRSMEEIKRLGLAKSIGVSNFNMSQIERIMANCEITPSVLQVEVNLNLAQDKLLEFCNRHNIAIMAYSPFGFLFKNVPTAPPPRPGDPILADIASKHNVTATQVILKYLVQRGVMPIPKSVNKNRIEMNIDIFDFELTAEEMNVLSKFNKNRRVVWPTFRQEHPYYPFERSDTVDGSEPFKISKTT